MFSWFGRRWRREQRRYDLKYAWPACLSTHLRRGGGLRAARLHFLSFAQRRDAWTEDFTALELTRFCLQLDEDTRDPL
jgi:hypothetical protein